MIDLIKHPITISIILIILAVLIKLWFDEQKAKRGALEKKQSSGIGKKAKDFGKTTMRLLRRKALRKSLEDGDWKYK